MVKHRSTTAGLRYAAAALIALVLVGGAACSQPDSTEPSQKLSPMPEAIPSELFGMHIHNAAKSTPWPAEPIMEWRLWDAGVAWPQLEPGRGQWQFGLLDKYLALARQHNTGVLLTLALSPRWASARPDEKAMYSPGSAAEPADVEDWRTYVRTVATHCKGKVQAYEIWNEPNSAHFWTGNIDQLVTLTREASIVIKSIDPSAMVISPPPTGGMAGVKWLSEFLAAGGGRYVDVIGFHFYVYPKPPEASIAIIQAVRNAMDVGGVRTKPLWNTETGWGRPTAFPSETVAAGYLARDYILNWAAGVQRFYWYAWDNHNWVSLETTRSDSQTLTPAGTAYGIIQKWMTGARMVECFADQNQTWACRLDKGEVSSWIVWNPGSATAFEVPPSWHAVFVRSLLGESNKISGTTVSVSQVPELLSIQ
jgi:hypothetical protein